MSDDFNKAGNLDGGMLPGRRLLLEKIEAGQDSLLSGEGNSAAYCLAIGIKNLPVFNETFGAGFAEEVVAKTGQRLWQIVREKGALAQINSDMFGYYMDGAPAGEAAEFASHILANFQKYPLQTDKGPVNVQLSIGGITVFADDPAPAQEILTKAEVAIDIAQESGRQNFVHYNDVARQASEKSALTNAHELFLGAMKDGRVKLAFQPIMNARTGEVSFHETLLRVLDDEGNLLPARDFIPAIEKHGLSRIVDQFALQMALEELKKFKDLRLSVNISNRSLVQGHWRNEIIGILKENPEPSQRLIIEVTETSEPLPPEDLTRAVRQFQECGCQVALDDFGSGYTAFAQLKEHNFDIVKIDQAFVRDIDQEHNYLFIKTLMDLADGFDIETVAEGAESHEDAEILIRDGIKHIQGFIYGFPEVERLWLPEDHKHRHFETKEENGASKKDREGSEPNLIETIARFWKDHDPF